MLRLAALGGLTLAADEGLLTGTATQRRRLGLLALLAVARDQGVSRDKLLNYLWPESDEPRARHGLNQLLYAQRRHLGEERLFLGEKTLRLNRDLVRTDVGDFEDALDRDDFATAVSVYRGPFLDGFYIKDAPDFERWTEAHRERLAARCLSALRSLARAAIARGEHAKAVPWLERARELRPLDVEVSLEYVEALASAGNRPEALRQAEQFNQALKRDLGMPPDPRLVEIAHRMRTPVAGTPIVKR